MPDQRGVVIHRGAEAGCALRGDRGGGASRGLGGGDGLHGWASRPGMADAVPTAFRRYDRIDHLVPRAAVPGVERMKSCSTLSVPIVSVAVWMTVSFRLAVTWYLPGASASA